MITITSPTVQPAEYHLNQIRQDQERKSHGPGSQHGCMLLVVIAALILGSLLVLSMFDPEHPNYLFREAQNSGSVYQPFNQYVSLRH